MRPLIPTSLGMSGFFLTSFSFNFSAQPSTLPHHALTMSTKLRFLTLLLFAGLPSSLMAELSLGSPFQNDMVLQRDKEIFVWGTADADASVSVTINGVSNSGTANDNGRWKIALPALSSGGPFIFTATDGDQTITLNDVLVGDVWLAFGQSNMVRPVNDMSGALTYINDIRDNDLPIRCLKIDTRVATTEQDKGNMTWLDNSNPGTWTSVGTVFANQMYHATGVPTAIIWAAWGSSNIEGWMPLSMTEQFPHFAGIMQDYYDTEEDRVIGMLNGSIAYDEVWIRQRPNILYNQMIHPVTSYGISGFVWYQGEANADNLTEVAQYGFTLPGFVREYRSRFDQGELPFLAVQLPSYNYSTWAWFREAQNRITSVPNAYVAVTIDTGSSTNIHPADKEPVGIRLSRLAREHVYGENIESHGPTYQSMTIAGNEATIQLDHANSLYTKGREAPRAFEIAGADQIFHPTTSAVISGTKVILSSTAVPNPVAVRYAWTPSPNSPTAVLNLINRNGLPAAPFRTDSWPIPGLPAHPPQSVADSYTVAMNGTLEVGANGILANDIDLNHDPLTASVITTVEHGTLALLADGSFTYTPTTGYVGPDRFTYKASETNGNLESPTATVTLIVHEQTAGFLQWQSTINWNAADDNSIDGDPDGDTVTNFLEFALGLDPLSPDSSGLPTLTRVDNDFYSFDFNNMREGLTYDILVSTDLITWSDPAFASLTSESDTPVQVPITLAENGKLYVRLRVRE
ncbi:sialate O-acetylesterase [Verrucomicrobiaceae bacterium 227]